MANDNDKDKNKIIVQDVQLEDIKKEDEKKPEPPPPPPPPKPEPPKVEITKFTPPKIVKDEEVKEPPPPVEKLEETKLVQLTRKVRKTKVLLLLRLKKKVPVLLKLQKRWKKITIRCLPKLKKKQNFLVEWMAGKDILKETLNANVAADDGAPAGNYTVKVQFIVDKEGGIAMCRLLKFQKLVQAADLKQ